MDDKGLLQRARHFDPRALQYLHQRFYGPVFRYLVFKSADTRLAEDLAGDVFLRMLTQLKRNGGWRTTPQAWIFGIARNTLADHYRSLSRRGREVPLEVAERTFSKNGSFAPASALRLDLLDALKQLPADYQEVLILRFIERMKIREAAEIMDRTPMSIKALQRRALIQLSALLAEAGETERSRYT